MWSGVSEPDPKSEEATICTPETEQLSLLLGESSPNAEYGMSCIQSWFGDVTVHRAVSLALKL